MSIVHCVGTRPQFIKLSVLWPHCPGVVWCSGQHYDQAMTGIPWLEELDLGRYGWIQERRNEHNSSTPLGVAELMTKFNRFLEGGNGLKHCIVYGDCDTTLACALVAARRGLRVYHVESGLRSSDPHQPEEQNRVLVESIAYLTGDLFPVWKYGDLLKDAFMRANREICEPSPLIPPWPCEPVCLLSLHRAGVTRADVARARKQLLRVYEHVIVAGHPRHGLYEPLSYFQVQQLLAHDCLEMVVTDSGGLVREAYWSGLPTIVPRTHTEWPALTNGGWMTMVDPGCDLESTVLRWRDMVNLGPWDSKFGGTGTAGEKIGTKIMEEASVYCR